jgi:hypothetical protein
MNRLKAKSILVMLDKINKEIDVLAKMLVSDQLKPVPVRIRVQNPPKLK